MQQHGAKLQQQALVTTADLQLPQCLDKSVDMRFAKVVWSPRLTVRTDVGHGDVHADFQKTDLCLPAHLPVIS